MKIKHIFSFFLMFTALLAKAQTPFPTGIRFPNATEVTTADSIPVIGPNNSIKTWISLDNLLAGAGSGLTQDNKYKIVETTAYTSADSIATAVNELAAFTVSDTEILLIKNTYVDTVDISISTVKQFAVLNELGKDDYGTGGTALTGSNLEIISTTTTTDLDYSLDAATQYIDLGEIGLALIENAFNAHTFTGSEDPVQSQEEGYVIVDATRSGEAAQWLFVGEGGNYGSGGSETAVSEDFTLLGQEPEQYDVFHVAGGSMSDTGITATEYTGHMVHNGNIKATGFSPVGGLYTYYNGISNKDANWLDVSGNQGLLLRSSNTNEGYVEITSGRGVNHSQGLINTYDIDPVMWNILARRRYDDEISYPAVATKFVGIEIQDKVSLTNKEGWYAGLRINPQITEGSSNQDSIYAIRAEAGKILLADYGEGSITGTATYSLAVDANGNVIEEALGGGGSWDHIAIQDIDMQGYSLFSSNQSFVNTKEESFIVGDMGAAYTDGNISLGVGISAIASATITSTNDLQVNSDSGGLHLLGGTTVAIDAPVITLGTYEVPTTDGSAGQVYTTDGNGTVTWQDASGGSSIDFLTETFTYTEPTTTFTLSNTPNDIISVFVNRTPIFKTTVDDEYDISGSTLDIDNWSLTNGDIIRITYSY